MPITRTPIINDSGSGTDGTVIDNAWKQEFYNQIDAAGMGSGTMLMPFVLGHHSDLILAGPNVNDWPLPPTTLVFVSGVAAGITGMVAPAQNGTVKIFLSMGPSLTFFHQSTGSAAPNRFIGVGYTHTAIAAWKSQTMVYSVGLSAWILLT